MRPFRNRQLKNALFHSPLQSSAILSLMPIRLFEKIGVISNIREWVYLGILMPFAISCAGVIADARVIILCECLIYPAAHDAGSSLGEWSGNMVKVWLGGPLR